MKISAGRSEEKEDHGDAGSTQENTKSINKLMGINKLMSRLNKS
jgi:hypothetical protein